RGARGARGEPRRRPRADGHHDAGARRLRGHAPHPLRYTLRQATDHFADRQGDEGRSREEHRIGGIRLHHQARRDRPAPLADAGVALPLGAATDGAGQRPAAEQLELETLELRLLLEGIYRHYGYDFREYAPASLRRRVWRRV